MSTGRRDDTSAMGTLGQGDPIVNEYRTRLALYKRNTAYHEPATKWKLNSGYQSGSDWR
jgi:hypothetical protein